MALAVGPSPAGVLFRAGDAAMLDGRPCVAVVGTRRCTPEGAAVAYQLGYDLSEAGIRVVSGLALGIDGAAHAGALAAARDAGAGEAGRAGPGGGIGAGGSSGEGNGRGLDGPGSTVGVAASGVDVVYPRRHAELWREVVRVGAVVSETPPGTPAQAWRFPVRNRIIAGLARMVVVVECHASGGSWHTVDAALRRGVEVGAVPGSVQSSASAGSNTLLHEGATPVRGARDVLDALGMLGGPARAPRAGEARRGIGAARFTRGPGAAGGLLEIPVRRVDAVETVEAVGALEARVLASIGWRPLCLEDVVERSGLPVTAVVVALERLERRGALEADAGWWARKRC
jgi:DNA processing protein